jgi:hypoxanthine phosphoribosyltransferase
MPARSRQHLKTLLRHAAIQRRVRQMGREITRDFRGKPVHLVGVLNGAAIFLSDLIREIKLEVSLDFMAVSSYGSSDRSSGEVRVTKDLDASIEGRNVILVEDILDTGFTIGYLERLLRQRHPATFCVAVLLDKIGRRVQPVQAHYVGFRIPDDFVVGYGLDFAGQYRNRKDICILNQPGVPDIREPRSPRSRRSARSTSRSQKPRV